MAWKVELTPLAERNLDKLDPHISRRILSFLHGRLAVLDNPRRLGEALKGSKLGEFWKYRVGDYRIISSIEDETLTIYVIRIGNRRRPSLPSKISHLMFWKGWAFLEVKDKQYVMLQGTAVPTSRT